MLKRQAIRIVSAACISYSLTPAFADDPTCGPTPALPTVAQSSETVKGQLQGQADLLSKLVGKTELSGAVEAARRNIYQSSDQFFAAQKDAYLAYIFCTLIINDKTLDITSKINALNKFKHPVEDVKHGVIRVIDSKYLHESDREWHFTAPAGAVIEVAGLSCPASIIAGDFRGVLTTDGKAPVPGDAGQNVSVSISFDFSRGPFSASCHGKFWVSAPD